MTLSFKNIMETNPDLTITTDASNTGWGRRGGGGGQFVREHEVEAFGVWKNNLLTLIS